MTKDIDVSPVVEIIWEALAAERADQGELASEYWHKITAQFTDNPAPLLDVAERLIAQNALPLADALLGQMVRSYPTYLMAALKWMECAIHRADWDETLRRGVLARRRFPNSSFGYVMAAQAFRESHRLNEADALFDEAAARFPSDAGAVIQWADCAVRRSDWAVAELRLKMLRENFPDVELGYTLSSHAFREAGHIEELEALLTTAVELFPTSQRLCSDWVDSAESSRDWPEVVRRGMILTQRFPASQQGYASVYRGLRELNRLDEAEAQLKEAAYRFPGFSAETLVGAPRELSQAARVQIAALWDEAEKLTGLQKLMEAGALLDKALSLDPGDAQVLRRRIQLAMNAGEHDVALAAWRRLKSDPAAQSVLCFDLAWTIVKVCPIGDDAMELLLYLVNERDTGTSTWLPQLAEFVSLRSIRPELVQFTRENLPRIETGEFVPATLQILKSALLIDYSADDVRGFIEHYVAGGRTAITTHLFSLTFTHEKPESIQMFRTVFDDAVDRWLAAALSADYQNFDRIFGLLRFAAVFSHKSYRRLVESARKHLDVAALSADRSLQTPASVVGGILAAAVQNGPRPPESPNIARIRRLKIAVCVSGQLRGFRAAFPTWQRFGFGPHDTRYFVHTWKGIGRNWFRFWRFTQKRELLWEILRQEDSISLLAPRYPKMAAACMGHSTCDADELRAFYGTDAVVVEDDTQPPLKDKGTPWKMHNKIERAHRLAIDSGIEFDLYIRIRPDREVVEGSHPDWYSVMQRSRQERMIFADQPLMFGHRKLSFGDQFAAGCREIMDDYSNIFSWTMNYIAAGQTPLDMYPSLDNHGSMAHRTFYGGMLSATVPDLKLGHLFDPVMLTPAELVPLIEHDVRNRSTDEFDREFLAACREEIR